MLFDSFTLGSTPLNNRVVMAPMTRNRAVDHNTANALMAKYYAQRANAGLIITEGTSPSYNGLGYARIPGLFNTDHVKGWRLVTEAVHRSGGKIFVQLMHTGRVANRANLPLGAHVMGPTTNTCPGEIWTDARENQPYSPPLAMTEHDIMNCVAEFEKSATLAIEAGFDGIELHAANGYLIEQFLNANINDRIDAYGGTTENRNRFALEIVRATVKAIGAKRVGIRLSPYGVFNSTGPFEGMEAQYLSLARQLSTLELLYVHLVDHSAMGAPPVPAEFKANLRNTFSGALILSGGFDRDSAEKALTENRGDLVAFGRPYLANPDLVARMKANAPLNTPDPSTFYTSGAKGYTDYPTRTE